MSPPGAPPSTDPADLALRASAVETVLALARIVASAEDLATLAARSLEEVQAHTGCPAVCLFRYDELTRVFRLVAQRGLDVSRFPALSAALPAEGSLTGIAAARGCTVTTSDIAVDPRIEPETRARLVGEGFGEGASVPILHHGQLVGALNLIYRAGARLGAEERRLLEAMAGTLGVAMAQRLADEARERLEAQAGRAQQLEVLGVLAGGIAHDFNNLLVGITGNLDLAREEASASGLGETVEVLDEALLAAGRARALVRQLLTFARGGAPVKQATTALAEVVAEAARFALRGTSVRCDVSCQGALGVVEVDAGQLGQVVQNLVLNAAQHSPSGATVSIRLDRRRLAEPEPPLPAGDWIRLRVSDEGSGIAPEVLPRIFEPFFSARPGGSGLGLAVCHSVVRRHGGQVAVASVPGQGATFTIHLPAGAPAQAAAPPAVEQAAPPGGRALVMDDEPVVREVARRMLERLRYEVACFADGAAALAAAGAAQADGRPFDVALLDVTVVGGVGGLEVIPGFRRASPGTRLVVSTGHAAASALADPGAAGVHGVLEKPYTIEELRAALRAGGT